MTANTFVIDKFAFVQGLEKRGFTRSQAEGIAETVTDIALAQLVSKADLHAEMADLQAAMAQQKIDIFKFFFTGIATQTALIVGLIELLK